MPRIEAFEAHAQRYEAWFDQHQAAYLSELLALRALVPWSGRGLEIGVGTARFAAPLGIQVGIDPSPKMLELAATRGITVVKGTAEALPFDRATFDHALVATTICFVDSPARMLAEARRVLVPDGRLVIGFIDPDSIIGRHYVEHQAESSFYRDARFQSVPAVERLLHDAGFVIDTWGQTLSHALAETTAIEPLRPGVGRCAFVVVAAHSPR
jgi:ubiquinone/menaquinone biosynthesis C-methylase UbiE